MPYSLYWYLYVLFVFYVVFIPLLRCQKLHLLLPIFLVLSLLTHDIPSLEGFGAQKWLTFNAFFFCGGIVLYRTRVFLPWGAALAALAVSVALCVVFWGNDAECPDSSVSHMPYVDTLVALGLCLFFWKLFSSVKALNVSVLNICGRYSLEIYVTHCFLMAGFRAILPALGITSFWPVFILNSALSTAIPILIAVALQRVGIHDAVFRPAYFVKSLIEARRNP